MDQAVAAAPTGMGAHAGPTHAGPAHPSPRRYIQVAAFLAAIIGVEIGLYYTSLDGYLLVSILLGLAAIKFGMVAAYFMHLKFDSRLLRQLFITGIILSLFVYTIFLLTMDLLLH